MCFLFTDEILLLFGRKTFCNLYNARSMLLNWSTRFYYSASDRKYFVAHNGAKHYFLNKRQALNAYRKGVPERARYLGACYHLDQIPFQKNDVVVDCGANVGDLLLALRSLGFSGKYIGFEPSPSEFSCLDKNSNDSEAYNLGLWNTDGSLEFFISSDGADSSFIRPKIYEQISEIKTVRLDEKLPSDLKIKLLKIEAEGAEPEVIHGVEGLLPNVNFITADLGYERGVMEESTLCPVVNYLLARNFELVSISSGRLVALFRNRNYDT